jgi:1,2-diacylglycerol 3-beta-glucosyltransferase
MNFEPFLQAILILYVLHTLWLWRGLLRGRMPHAVAGTMPFVSVIVAARNEEDHIGECLQSILRTTYPAHLMEIIVVNDGSTDRTGDIAASFSREQGHVRVINSLTGVGNLRGKTNAVCQGINASRGEILMFTDADCTVPPGWVSHTVAAFEEGIGIVGGFTLLEHGTWFQTIQSLDWTHLFGVAGAMAGYGSPLTVIGNNLSVRRSAYDATGGFENIPFSVTEDYALVQAIVTRTDYRAAFPMQAATQVSSKACTTVRQLFRQKQRWGVGGLDMIWPGMAVMAVSWLTRATIIAALCSGSTGWGLTGICIIAASDLLFLSAPLKTFGRLLDLKWFPLFELYFTGYMLVLPVVAFFSREIVWKERKL